MATDLSSQMWATFGHGSPAFNKANHRQQEGILYVRQVLRRSDSPMNSQSFTISGRKESGAGEPVLGQPDRPSVITPDSGSEMCPRCRGNVCNCVLPKDDIYHLTDKAIRSRILDCWLETLETAEIESIRDACDVELVERGDSDDWEEVVLADDEREEATKTK